MELRILALPLHSPKTKHVNTGMFAYIMTSDPHNAKIEFWKWKLSIKHQFTEHTEVTVGENSNCQMETIKQSLRQLLGLSSKNIFLKSCILLSNSGNGMSYVATGSFLLPGNSGHLGLWSRPGAMGQKLCQERADESSLLYLWLCLGSK